MDYTLMCPTKFNAHDTAELIGVMLGDGSIPKQPAPKSGQNRIKVTLDSRDEQYIRYLAKLLMRVTGKAPFIRKRTGENTCDLLLFGSEIVVFFVDNLKLIESPKWERARVPAKYFSKEYAADVMRGYFDTDGSVVIANNNGTKYPRLEMKICPSPMQKQLIGFTQMLNLPFKIHQIGKGKIRLQANGVNALRCWSERVGFKNQKHMRKAEPFLGGNKK